MYNSKTVKHIYSKDLNLTLCFFSRDCTLASSLPTSSLETMRKMSNIQASTSSASAKNYNVQPDNQ